MYKNKSSFSKICLSFSGFLLINLSNCAVGEKPQNGADHIKNTPITQLNPAFIFPQNELQINFQDLREKKPETIKLIKKLLHEYVKIHTNIRINLVEDQGNEGTLSVPDLGWVNLGEPSRQGFTPRVALPPQLFLHPAPAWVEKELRDRLSEGTSQSARRGAALYGFPEEPALGPVLFYNKTLFKEAGLNRPPKNTIELVEWAKKLTKYDKNGEVIQAGWAIPWAIPTALPEAIPQVMPRVTPSTISLMTTTRKQNIKLSTMDKIEILQGFEQFLYCFKDGADGFFFNEKYTDIRFNRPEIVAALEYYKKFIFDFKIVNLCFPPPALSFKAGLAAMTYQEPSFWYELNRETLTWQWGIAPQVEGKPPYGKYLPGSIPKPGKILAVMTKDGQKAAICWDIMLFMYLNYDLPLAEAQGTYPLLKANWQTAYAQHHPLAPVVGRQTARPCPKAETHPRQGEIEALLGEAVYRVIITKVDPKLVLDETAEKARLLLKK